MQIEFDFKQVKRKPIILNAIQLTKQVFLKIMPRHAEAYSTCPEIAATSVGKYEILACRKLKEDGSWDCFFLINTLEDVDERTKHRAEIGDYLIKGVNGEIWAVKPEIFHETYEEINE